MSSTYGEAIKLSIFGQSHGAAIGMTLDGIPAGLQVDEEKLQRFMARRAPGAAQWTSSRKEADRPEFLSGIINGHTCGAPIAAIINNSDARPSDYASVSTLPRPGHADLTAQLKYGGYQDARGGGHFSGRLTAPLCIAGGLCMQWLESMGICIGAHIISIGAEEAERFDPLAPQLDAVDRRFPTLTARSAQRFQDLICRTAQKGDSVGGKIECAVTGLPAGIGEPIFGGLENRIASLIFGIPAVKAIAFGETAHYGSENNDQFTYSDNKVITETNHAGGILGGISNGMPLLFTVSVKPTPSIRLPQKTVDLNAGKDSQLSTSGRHDPCIVPRAVPVVEAAAAIAIYDAILSNTQGR